MMRPFHQHDCTNCRYLGSTHSRTEQTDWYVCTSSVVGRYGSDGPAYWSMDKSMVLSARYEIANDLEGRQSINATLLTAREMLRRGGAHVG